jgi:argininosuccinate lyase
MPQKRNADPMELARGKTGRLIGHLTGFLTTLKGLPSGYNKDLQEDKEALFDSVDTVAKLLPVITAVIATLKLNRDQMHQALSEDLLATDLADYLVRKGVPFRQAHHVVGQVVRHSAMRGVPFSQLEVSEFQTFSPLFDQDVLEVFDFRAAVEKRVALGGTAPSAVQSQLEAARKYLSHLIN